jgi:hypothetical protein
MKENLTGFENLSGLICEIIFVKNYSLSDKSVGLKYTG